MDGWNRQNEPVSAGQPPLRPPRRVCVCLRRHKKGKQQQRTTGRPVQQLGCVGKFLVYKQNPPPLFPISLFSISRSLILLRPDISLIAPALAPATPTKRRRSARHVVDGIQRIQVKKKNEQSRKQDVRQKDKCVRAERIEQKSQTESIRLR